MMAQRLARKQLAQVLAQEVGGDNSPPKRRVITLQILHRFAVDFHHAGFKSRVLQQVAREHAHAWPDFQYVRHAIGQPQGLHDIASNIGVGQKVLTEVFFGANVVHFYFQK